MEDSFVILIHPYDEKILDRRVPSALVPIEFRPVPAVVGRGHK